MFYSQMCALLQKKENKIIRPESGFLHVPKQTHIAVVDLRGSHLDPMLKWVLIQIYSIKTVLIINTLRLIRSV